MKKKCFMIIAFFFLVTGVACSNIEVSQSAGSEAEEATKTYKDFLARGVSEESAMNWDETHMSKEQFQEFLQSLTAVYEEEQHFVEAKLTGEHEIQLVFNNEDGESFENTFLVQFIDNFVRQLYIHSDYGDNQPTIIFKNLRGDVIAKNSDFISGEATDTQSEIEISTMN